MLSYIGGKSRISSWIIPFIPKDIETYVEPFSGMFWVYFKMKLEDYPNLNKIVYNDFNPLNYNLFLCVQNPDQLLNEINRIPCQEKGVEYTPELCGILFNSFQKELFEHKNIWFNEPDYEMAAKYVYILTQIFSGSKPETSSYIDLKGKYKSKYLTFRDKLSKEEWVDHFTSITDIENMDFAKVIEKYDSPTSYFYLDPPYYKTENYYSNHDFGLDDHERLANTLKTIQGKFSMSYYYFPQLEEWFPKDQYRWESKEFAKAAGASKNKKQGIGEELLIMNY
jgi:DNA adenine methylase